jgi:hypothetical protein
MQSLSERNISFSQLRETLAALEARKVDTVKAATELRVLDSGGVEVTESIPGSAETMVTAYQPNDVFTGHLADTFKTGLPLTRRLFAERPDVAADLFNGLMHGRSSDGFDEVYPADPRSFLFRGYAQTDDAPATARALLSSRYLPMDNYDVLTAALEGMQAVPNLEGKVTVSSADLSDRHLFVNFMAPQIGVSAAALLEGYRSPFNSPGVTRAGGFENLDRVVDMMRRYGGDGQTLWAGFKLKNSEVGDGKFKIVPYAKFRVCFNGLAIESDAIDQVHLGGRLEAGAIDWSSTTQQKRRELISSMTADAVGKFLSAEYWDAQVAKLAEKAGKVVPTTGGAIERVGKALNFSEQERQDIWTHFMLGGQPTAGGLMNAVTSVAQTLPSAERADALEAAAVKVLDLV